MGDANDDDDEEAPPAAQKRKSSVLSLVWRPIIDSQRIEIELRTLYKLTQIFLNNTKKEKLTNRFHKKELASCQTVYKWYLELQHRKNRS